MLLSRVVDLTRAVAAGRSAGLLRAGEAVRRGLVTDSWTAEPISHRSVIRVGGGQDAFGLLQGLCTNDLNLLRLGHRSSLTAAFLNSKGRIVFDSHIYAAGEDALLLEVDSALVETVMKHLKLYRLRRRVDIDPDCRFQMWSLFNASCEDPPPRLESQSDSSEPWPWLQKLLQPSAASGCPPTDLATADPRLEQLGYRLLVSESNEAVLSELRRRYADTALKYAQWRYKLGVCEGRLEITPDKSFPLEYNFDLLNGISFSKGCYIGQELTARTYHTGVVRKRIMPLLVLQGHVHPDCVVLNQKQVKVGTIRAAHGRFAVGLMRIADSLSAEELSVPDTGAQIRVLKPHWWPTPPSQS